MDENYKKLAAAVILQAVKDLSNSYAIMRKGFPVETAKIKRERKRYEKAMELVKREGGAKPVKPKELKNFDKRVEEYYEAQRYISELEPWFKSGKYKFYADAINFDVDARTILKKCKIGGRRMRNAEF